MDCYVDSQLTQTDVEVRFIRIGNKMPRGRRCLCCTTPRTIRSLLRIFVSLTKYRNFICNISYRVFTNYLHASPTKTSNTQRPQTPSDTAKTQLGAQSNWQQKSKRRRKESHSDEFLRTDARKASFKSLSNEIYAPYGATS